MQQYIKIPQTYKYLNIESQVILTTHVQFQYPSNYKVQKIVFVLSDISTQDQNCPFNIQGNITGQELTFEYVKKTWDNDFNCFQPIFDLDFSYR